MFLTTPGEAPTGRTERPEGGGWGPSEAETGLSGISPSSHLYSAAATGPACRTSCPTPHPHPRKPAIRLKGRRRTKQAEGAGAPHPGGTDAGPSSNPEPNGVTGTLPVEGSAEALALIRRCTGTRAPGLADRRGALPPCPSRRPSTRSHSGGLRYPDAPRHLGRPRSSCAGGSRPRESPGRGVLPRHLSRRRGVWFGSSGGASPQSSSAQLPARRPLQPVRRKPKPGVDLSARPLQEPARAREGAASGSEDTLVRRRLLPGPRRACCL